MKISNKKRLTAPLVAIVFMLVIPVLSLSKETPSGMVYISAGEFIMGNDGSDLVVTKGNESVDEAPRHVVNLKAFYIDKYEVTNKQYKAFLNTLQRLGVKRFSHYNDDGVPVPDRWVIETEVDGKSTDIPIPDRWSLETYPPDEADYPVVDVDWYMASKYCSVNGKRLPAEEEWEKAARGTDGRIFPWGNVYKIGVSNNQESWEINLEHMVDVGRMKEDVSPYGVHDMAGNAMEWTSSLYRPYPGSNLDRDIFKLEKYVLRGGASNTYLYEFGRTTARHFRGPTDNRDAHADWHTDMNIGFRCAADE
ncbi:MAG: SUMF1/EgtB/PvdO family nonheme iron enzyme [Deltaproteobacteria bacterium]|nr:SUMF1/EgtB/PvdO family nonheme iron enzyme [Deltaproteobacteria bacterium]